MSCCNLNAHQQHHHGLPFKLDSHELEALLLLLLLLLLLVLLLLIKLELLCVGPMAQCGSTSGPPGSKMLVQSMMQ